MDNIVARKVCVICGVEKELSDFYKHRKAKFGVANQCKPCANIIRAKYYKSHSSKLKAQSNEYYLLNRERVLHRIKEKYKENPEIVKKRARDWNVNNKEKKVEKSHKWYLDNTERTKKNVVIWQKNNPEKLKAHRRNRRAREKGSGLKISSKQWEILLEQYECRCLRCGKVGIKLTMDHVLPLSLGGEHRIENIQPLCKPCNSAKGTKYIDYR